MNANTGTASTSAMARANLSVAELKSIGDYIESVVVHAMRGGARNMSMREIQQALLDRYGRKEDMSSISARVNALVKSGRLLRDKVNTRPCSVTGQYIQPISATPAQVGMFY